MHGHTSERPLSIQMKHSCLIIHGIPSQHYCHLTTAQLELCAHLQWVQVLPDNKGSGTGAPQHVRKYLTELKHEGKKVPPRSQQKPDQPCTYSYMGTDTYIQPKP